MASSSSIMSRVLVLGVFLIVLASCDAKRSSQYLPTKGGGGPRRSLRPLVRPVMRASVPRVSYSAPATRPVSKANYDPFLFTNDAQTPLRYPTKGTKGAPPRSLPPPPPPPSTTTMAPIVPELPLSKKCLGCLCDATTNCDPNIKCVLNQFCGSYLISQAYWTDAGRIGHDYRSCVFNKTCAEETVDAYMTKNAVDCNRDGFIDCDDYVTIHQLGPQCQNVAASSNFYTSNYWNYYQFCYRLSPEARREPLEESGAPPPPVVRDDGRKTIVEDFPGQRPEQAPVAPPIHRPFNSRPHQTTTAPPAVRAVPSPPQPSSGGTNDLIEVTKECLDCLCESSGGCANRSLSCDTSRAAFDSGHCGPFQFDWTYWMEAGKPGYRGAASDFQRCANDRSCAEITVRRYLNKWAMDCNGDGSVDCADFMAIHRLGPKHCGSEAIYGTTYYRKFQNCYGFGRR